MQPRVNGKYAENDLRQRLDKKIDKSGECWLWTGSKDPLGYGNLYFRGKTEKAHRVLYKLNADENIIGELDHLCRNTSCVNPKHLEDVTHQENVARACQLKRKDYCIRGHKFTEDSVYYYYNQYGTRKRKCKACSSLIGRRRYERIKLESKDE